jgi:hypothetical protein
MNKITYQQHLKNFDFLKTQLNPNKMKKVLLLFITLMAPAYLFAQISIRETTYELLTDAIGASVSGDTIEIAGPVMLTGQVGLNHASGVRTFRGMTEDASITLANGARFILEAAGETVFSDITLIGAEQAHEDWGAMLTLFNGPTLTLKNATLQGAKTSAHAGAMRITSGATVKAYNTIFKNNEANQNGGVAFIEAGNTETLFENCVFIGNKCGTNNPDAKGGALFYAQGADEGDHIVKNSAFIQNESSNHGGAIGMETVSPEFINCTFTENAAVDNGGAIWMWNGSGESTTTIVNCTIIGNVAGNGGALFMNQAESHYDVVNTVFSDNGEMGIATGTAPATISIKNSYFPALPEGLTESSGATTNIHEGDLMLADIDVEGGIYYFDVTSEESVLVGLGNPGLLQPYSRVDQRGVERDLDRDAITAGSIEFPIEDPVLAADREKVKTLSVYPNPSLASSGVITINSKYEGKIAFYNASGKLVATRSVKTGENKIDISSLPESLYVIKNTSRNGAEFTRFVKR